MLKVSKQIQFKLEREWGWDGQDKGDIADRMKPRLWKDKKDETVPMNNLLRD